MKKPNRLLAFLFAAAMLLSLLTACSKTPPAPAPTENNSKPSMSDSESMDSSALMPEDGAALKLWFDNDTYNEKIVELWNAKYPGVALTVENVGTTDARQKMSWTARQVWAQMCLSWHTTV